MTGYEMKIIRVEESDRTRIETDGDLLGRGCQFPDGTVVLWWNREVFPEDDRLDHPHHSQYGSLADVQQGSGGEVIVEETL